MGRLEKQMCWRKRETEIGKQQIRSSAKKLPGGKLLNFKGGGSTGAYGKYAKECHDERMKFNESWR
jgi:hypothetical protein